MLKLHHYCKNNNLAHIIIFSGRGFHIYVLVEVDPINTILDVMYFQNRMIAELNIDLDHTILGNASHLIRIPGTFNPKRNRWCISLREQELNDFEAIKRLAENQRTTIYKLKGNNLKLEHHKSSDKFPERPLFTTISIDNAGIDVHMIIPCLRTNIRPKGHLTHIERVYLTMYLSEFYRCYTPINQLSEEQITDLIDTIVDFFEPILNDFNEYITRYQVSKIVRKYEFCPNCDTLKAKGLCIENTFCWRRKC
jgi:hypothetical protein